MSSSGSWTRGTPASAPPRTKAAAPAPVAAAEAKTKIEVIPPEPAPAPAEELYGVGLKKCVPKNEEVEIYEYISDNGELFKFVVEKRYNKNRELYIIIRVNKSDKYYCLSQMELLKIKFIQYGLYFYLQK